MAEAPLGGDHGARDGATAASSRCDAPAAARLGGAEGRRGGSRNPRSARRWICGGMAYWDDAATTPKLAPWTAPPRPPCACGRTCPHAA